MPSRERKRLPSAVLEKARQLAGTQEVAPPAPPGNTVAEAGETAAPALPGRQAVKAKITNALRKLHPMD